MGIMIAPHIAAYNRLQTYNYFCAVQYEDQKYSLFRGRSTGRTQFHCTPIELILERRQGCSNGNTDANTKKCKSSFSGCEVMMFLKDNREGGKQCIQDSIFDSNVDSK